MEQDPVAPVTVLKLEQGLVEFKRPPADAVCVPLDSIYNSSLLRDLADSADDSAEAILPVTWGALHLWLHHTQYTRQSTTTSINGSHEVSTSTDRGATAAAAAEFHGGDALPAAESLARHGPSIARTGRAAELCVLMLVSDVLIDEGTKAHCAAEMARLLHDSSTAGSLIALSAVSTLVENLQLAVLSVLPPFPHCLRHLPPSWHPLALRAHHPSIDTHATLALHCLPIARVGPALSAAATIPTIQKVSFSGRHWPLDCVPCIDLLGSGFSAVTALILRDIDLQLPHAKALARVLPMLRQLQSLNLGSNYITPPVMDELAPALRHCTGLRCLDLWETLSGHVCEGNMLHDLAAAIAAMPLLGMLAIGLYHLVDDRGRPGGCAAQAAGCEALMLGLQSLPHLTDLRLRLFNSPFPEAHAPAVLAGVAALTQLRSLHCALPRHLPPGPRATPGPFRETPPQLTRLQLDFPLRPSGQLGHASDAGSAATHAECASAALADLPGLTRLQCLYVGLPLCSNHAFASELAKTLATMLPQMEHLTSLQVFGSNEDALSWGSVLPVPDVASLGAVIDAALCMRRLRELHVPLVAGGVGDTGERRVGPLLQAAATMQVVFELYVRHDDERTVPGQPVLYDVGPLLPYVRTIDLWCLCEDSRLQTLLKRMPHMQQLRGLRIKAAVADSQNSPVIALLNSVSRLSCLVALHCSLVCGEQMFGLGQFLNGLETLTRLTRLSFDVPEIIQAGFLQLCPVNPYLQALDLGPDSRWRPIPARDREDGRLAFFRRPQ